MKSGEGRLDDGKQFWDLHKGMSILVPPNVPHRCVNGSREKELSMTVPQFTGAPEAHHELVVRNN